MRKFAFTVLVLSSLWATSSRAQNASASASQTVRLTLAPVIAFKFTATGSAEGNLVNLDFNNVNQFTNGVVSQDQELSIISNKTFKVSVQTDAASFSYNGNNGNTAMPVDNTLFVSVKNNNTGGAVASGFNNSYQSLNAGSQDLLLNGQQGADQRIVLAYKAKPGLNYPSGSYSVGVIYTATQP
ncbi:MAG: hypothetical protein EOP49_12095 [Sphingobacteriales bacterium]|nr:MAG: hypothetical protein EOP49_12095 [Sphingobacteriales bacterium]